MKMETSKNKLTDTTTSNRIQLLHDFYSAPPEALFDEEVVCAVRGCSKALTQRERWSHSGMPFIRLGRSIRYKKSDVLQWINQNQAVHSTSEYAAQTGGK